MRPNAGVFHTEFTSGVYDDTERNALLVATRERASAARLRSLTQCETCTNIIVQVNTDPGSLAVPRVCTACQPTATENTNA